MSKNNQIETEIYERCFIAALTGVLAGWNHGCETQSAVEVAKDVAIEATDHLLSERKHAFARAGLKPARKGAK
jgi:hypothetical protein